MKLRLDSPADRIFIALDVPDADSALQLVERIGDVGGSYKIGLQLYCAAGPAFVRQLAEAGKQIFLDLKFHDIPNTVAGAVRSTAELGAALLNVHCSGGPAMLQAARVAADEAGDVGIIGVTVLTSLGDEDLKELGIMHSTEGQVLELARHAAAARLDGVVCSPKEISPLRREFGDDYLLVTPGIRPEGAATGDQKRIMTPKEALDRGASALVIGRPITGADDPGAALRQIIDSL